MSYLGQDVKKLGFGLMRLPMIGDEIDLEQTNAMVDEFLAKGFTYFDTAYVYIGGNSEKIVKESLVKRHPRESFTIATKLPVWEVKCKEDVPRIFEEQLERTGAGYFDFYLMHGMDDSRISQYEDCGAWEYCRQMKKEGKIRHLGFSFHDTADVLDKILGLYPDTEFVQLQINYADWEDPEVQSRKCYEVCRKHNTPVVIMEPVKGGSLANMHPDVQQVFQAADPAASNASWAIRFCASLEGIITVLSGMSNMEQLSDNVSYMENFQPLNDEERKVLDHAVEVLKAIPTIPCTACKYCVDGCPQNINIPGIFSAFNHYKMYNNLSDAKRRYNDAVKNGGKASDCIKCLACESQCPQHIEITKQLEEAAELFE